MSDVRFLFALAAAHKAANEMEKVDEDFLATVEDGIPDGVRVVYLFVESAVPADLEMASYLDVLVLEMEGEEGQTMPVPLLRTLDPQLAASLFAAAEFRPREDIVDWDGEDWDGEDDGSWGGDESPPGHLDVVDWGCEDPWGYPDEDWDEYDD